MDDPAPIRPVQPFAARPPDRQRDRRPRRDTPEREQASTDASSDAADDPAPADAPAATTPLIDALDRLRATDAPRTADLAMLRLWRAMEAYAERPVGPGDAADAGSG